MNGIEDVKKTDEDKAKRAEEKLELYWSKSAAVDGGISIRTACFC